MHTIHIIMLIHYVAYYMIIPAMHKGWGFWVCSRFDVTPEINQWCCRRDSVVRPSNVMILLQLSFSCGLINIIHYTLVNYVINTLYSSIVIYVIHTLYSSIVNYIIHTLYTSIVNYFKHSFIAHKINTNTLPLNTYAHYKIASFILQ